MHVINQLGYGGGSERQLLLNIRHLDKDKVTSFICQLYPENVSQSTHEASNELRRSGFQVLSLEYNGSKSSFAPAIIQLSRKIQTIKPDLIHTNLLLSDLIGLLAGWVTRTPVIVSLVNATYGPDWLKDNPHISSSKHRLFLLLYRFCVRHLAAHVIANSKAVRHNAMQHLGLSPANVSVIYRSIVPKLERPGSDKINALRKELGLEGAYPVLLNVARVVPHKGQSFLLQAVHRLRSDYPHIKLLIAGETNSQYNLESLRNSLGLQENVLILGHRDDIWSLHHVADLGVFASLYEGFSNAFAEACMSGLPCVVTDIGGFTEVADDGCNAIVVPPRSPEALEQGIRCLLGNQELARQLGTQARQYVLTHFTVEQNIANLLAIYQAVASRHKAAQRGGRAL